MDNIYEALRESHAIQRSLCRSLARIQSREKAQPVFEALRLELAAHAAAEHADTGYVAPAGETH